MVTPANGLCGAGPFLKQRAGVVWGALRQSDSLSLLCFLKTKKTGDVCRYTHTRMGKSLHYKS